MWLALWIVVTLTGLVGLIATTASMRFSSRIDREVRELREAAARAPIPPHAISPAALDPLPAPVQRYLAKAIRRTTFVSRVELAHGGTFRTSLDGGWVPIAGRQFFATDPPAFIWWGRVRLAPGVWVDARDRSVGGVGSMYVAAESLITIADARGPALDQGALLRLLGELVWMPTALLDRRYVTWTPMDDRHARAALRVHDREVAATFTFGDDDLPLSFTAERERDLGGGRSAVTPFIGESRDFRDVDGLLVPFSMTAAWVVDGERKDYARFLVDRITFW
jgi:hypothetical protein